MARHLYDKLMVNDEIDFVDFFLSLSLSFGSGAPHSQTHNCVDHIWFDWDRNGEKKNKTETKAKFEKLDW